MISFAAYPHGSVRESWISARIAGGDSPCNTLIAPYRTESSAPSTSSFMKSTFVTADSASTSSSRRTGTHGSNRLVDGGRLQAVAPIMTSVHQVTIRLPRIPSQRAGHQFGVRTPVQAQVFLQPLAFARRRLNGNHSAFPSDALRGQQRVQPVMGARIDHRHIKPQQSYYKFRFHALEFVVEQLVVQRALLRQPPRTERQPQGDRHPRKSAPNAIRQCDVLLSRRAGQESPDSLWQRARCRGLLCPGIFGFLRLGDEPEPCDINRRSRSQ